MRFTILPKSILGKVSVGLCILFIILIWLKIQISIHMPTFAIVPFGIAGFLISIVAIFKSKDKAILNFLPILVGFVIILWIGAEIIFPH